MSVLLLEPDPIVKPRLSVLDLDTQVVRRLHFEDIGQKTTLIPHLLASRENSLELALDLIDRGIGGEIYFLVDPFDRLVIQLCRSLGIKVRSYNLDIFSQDDDQTLKFVKKLLNLLPIHSVLLNERYEILHVSESFAYTLPVDYSSVNLYPLIQSALSKIEPDKKPAEEVDILNFHGFCVIRKIELFKEQYRIAFLSSNLNAVSVMSNFEIVLNLFLTFFKKNSIQRLSIFSNSASLKSVISSAIQHLDEVLPTSVKIVSDISYDHPVSVDTGVFQALIQLLLIKAVVTLGSDCQLEIDTLPRLETGEIVVYIAGEAKNIPRLNLYDFPYLKVVTEYLEVILSELDEKIENFRKDLNITVKWSVQTARVECTVKILPNI